MKKEYVKPTLRFHKLRSRSMLALSQNETKVRVNNSDYFPETEWGD